MARSPIAVVSMAGLFPGAPTLEAFWQLIDEGRSTAAPVPPQRWPTAPADLLAAAPAPPGRVLNDRACLLDPFDLGAASDFPIEGVDRLDPLVRLVLRVGAEAWNGAATAALDRDRVSVVLANIALPTETSSRLTREVLGHALHERVAGAAVPAGSDADLGTDPRNRYVTGLPAALLAQGLGLGGGTHTLDAACASSLYALHLACEDLRAGRVDAVLAGGVNRSDCLYTNLGFSQLRALSPSGTCIPFDSRGDGLVVGEGAGIFLLKRLDDALAHGDAIAGLIAAVGLANDVGGSLLAPDSEGQTRAMASAYAQAGWTPSEVDLVECHGTGTPAGDRTELASIAAMFGDSPAVLGSVKSNVGHLLTGAAAAGFMKVLLALKHRTLPPTANFDPATALPELAAGPLEVLAASRPWSDPGRPRRAAVSAFGFGGIDAHLLVEEWRGPKEGMATSPVAAAGDPEPIAIVGLAARFGSLDSTDAFTRAGLDGTSAIAARPVDRWKGVEQSAWFRRTAGDLADLPGAYVERVDVEIGRFRIAPNELPGTLPQQLLMLQTAADAVEDCAADLGDRLRTGVIVGLGLDLETTSFHLAWSLHPWARHQVALLGVELSDDELRTWTEALEAAAGPLLDRTRTMGGLGSIAASRVARELKLGGPSFSVSSEDASGLRSLEVAARMLQRGEADAMIAGAVDLAGDVRAVLGTDRLRPWSRSGEARPLDHRADGPVPGEGAAAVVLKRLSDARRDGDRVYAVVTGIGSASNWDTAIARAWAEAGAAPSSAGLFETAAGGDPTGDAAEVASLAHAVKEGAPERPRHALAAVRSVVGDPGAAGGMASLVRAALALHHRTLPATAGFQAAADAPTWEAAGLHALPKRQAWLHDSERGPRRAGVSGAAIDGNRMHAVLEAGAPASQSPGPRAAGIVVAAADELDRLRAFLGERSGLGVEEVAARWYRLRGGDGDVAFAAESVPALLRRIDRPGPPVPRLEGEVAWVFPGSGTHYVGMGASLLAASPELHSELEDQTGLLASQLAADGFVPWRADWRDGWEADAEAKLQEDPRRIIFGQVAHGIAVGTALRQLGITPSAVIGYSLGESAGLFASRGWRDRDLMYRRVLDSRLFVDELVGACTVARAVYGTDDPDWVARVVDRPANEVRAALTGHARLLIINAPGECVIGGPRGDIEAVVEALGATASAPLVGVPTVHSDVLAPVADAYRALHVLPTSPPAGVRYYSGNAGVSYELTPEAAADSVHANATAGLDWPRTIEQAYADGVRVFVEGGPQGTCCRMIDRILGDRPHLAVAACQRGVDGWLALLRCAAKLVRAGVSVDLERLYGIESGVWMRPVRSAKAVVSVTVGGRADGTVPGVPAGSEVVDPARMRGGTKAPKGTGSASVGLGRGAAAVSATGSLVHGAMTVATATTAAHGEYLAFADQGRALADSLAQSILRWSRITPQPPHFPAPRLPGSSLQERLIAPPPASPAPFMDRAACLEFAIGSIANVLGPEFAPADTYPTRVRLPDEPLMLVDRVLSVTGEPRSMTGGTVVTEHDVLPGAWYLDGGRAPTCISVEAGQADLFLSGYLGIDLETLGERVYRLLDAQVTFHRDLPRVGETIRYDIAIDRFIRQGSTWLFFFRFEGWIGDEHLITMDDGCAGFFSHEQLHNGRGLVEDDPSEIPPRRPGTTPFIPLVEVASTTLDDGQVDALRTGDLEAAFGAPFAGRRLAPDLRLPGGPLRLVHRVNEIDPTGGNYGLGRITAETDVEPTAWYLTCHFVDDMVMPGTLMYEGCAHTLRILLLRMGWTLDDLQGRDVHYAPVEGESSALRCRGQVLDTTRTLTYQLDLKEIGYDPEPYVLADAVMFADGRKIVRFLNVAYRLAGADEAMLTAGWGTAPAPRTPVYSSEQLVAYCEGPPSHCFGPAFARFDDGTRLARLPRDPFRFLDRVMSIGYEPLGMKPSYDWTVAEWDVDPDAWFFAAAKTESIPFAVLLEAALQPCGFVSCAIGSPLHGDGLYYRNLGGTATMHFEPRRDIGTLTARARLDGHSEAGGMMLQRFTMDLHAGSRRLYSGTTEFGFFPPAAMRDQVGLRGAFRWAPDAPAQPLPLTLTGPSGPEDAALLGGAGDERLTLPAPVWTMVDALDTYLPEGGPQGLGFVSGSLTVDPDAWYFQAHFFQDPVIPGSLGLESFLQLLQAVALQRWPELHGSHRFEPIAVGREHKWQYRGQVVPTQGRVQVDCWIDSVEEGDEPVLTGSGLLSVDGRDIYSMSGFGLRLVRTA